MGGITITWDGATRREWHALLAAAPRSALQQGWAYGEALAASGVAVRRLVARDRAGRPMACAQVAGRRLLGLLRTGFLLRGPVWLRDDDAAAVGRPEPAAALLAAVRRELGQTLLVWAPDAVAAPPGRRAVVTGYSTSWLGLGAPPGELRRRLHGKWRNQLVRAEGAGLAVTRERVGGPGLAWLLAGNEAHRREVGYRGPSPLFLGRLAAAADAGGDLFCLLAREGKEPVAGVLVVRHGAAATYEVGHVTPRGRALRAKFLLLWDVLALLRAAGVRAVDLGGIDTERAPGIAGFKLGLGGGVETHAGTFLAMR